MADENQDLFSKAKILGDWLDQGKINKKQYDILLEKILGGQNYYRANQNNGEVVHNSEPSVRVPPPKHIQIQQEKENARKQDTRTAIGCLVFVIAGWAIYSAVNSDDGAKPTNANLGTKTVEKADPKKVAEQLEANVGKAVSAVAAGDIAGVEDALHGNFRPLSDAQRTRLEVAVLSYVKPLPASDFDANIEGYRLLYRIRPDKSEYLSKKNDYEERLRSSVLKPFRKKVDEIENVSFYTHRNSPKYLNSRSTAYIYLGNRGKHWWPRLKIIYTSDSWLFVDEVFAYSDGITSKLYDGRMERDNHTDIWEWADISPESNQLALLERLSKAEKAVLRFKGRQYQKDVTLRTSDKQAIRDAIKALEVLRR